MVSGLRSREVKVWTPFQHDNSKTEAWMKFILDTLIHLGPKIDCVMLCKGQRSSEVNIIQSPKTYKHDNSNIKTWMNFIFDRNIHRSAHKDPIDIPKYNRGQNEKTLQTLVLVQNWSLYDVHTWYMYPSQWEQRPYHVIQGLNAI